MGYSTFATIAGHSIDRGPDADERAWVTLHSARKKKKCAPKARPVRVVESSALLKPVAPMMNVKP
jgi:hypothetical protein